MWAEDGAVGQCAVYRRSHMTDNWIMYMLDMFARSIVYCCPQSVIYDDSGRYPPIHGPIM
jgi:hypothetical protein